MTRYKQELHGKINGVGVRKTELVLHDLIDNNIVTKEPAWSAVQFPAQSFNPAGGAKPPVVDTEDGSLLFEANKEEFVSANAQIPPAWIEGSQLGPHIHWAPTTANTGNVVWNLYYKAFNEGDSIPADWQTTVKIVVPASGEVAMHSGFGLITPQIARLGSTIVFKLERDGVDAEDTYPDNARLYSFATHYQTDRLGVVELSALNA